MAETVIQYILRRLNEIGVDDVFGVAGDYSFRVNDAIVEHPAINWIGCCNELNAGYAADGLYMAPPGGGVLEPVPWVTPARLGVHLLPGGRYEVYPYEEPDDDAAWLGVLALARWRKAARSR